jgi:pimeloyl-ACP methyl ester carboxylesterase
MGPGERGSEEKLHAASEAVIHSGIAITAIPLLGRLPPMIDLVNYAPRSKIPVLMINGRFDHHYPFEQSQRRLFDLLGTPAIKKAHIVYDTGHFTYPPNSVARDASNWFDQHLGTVR